MAASFLLWYNQVGDVNTMNSNKADWQYLIEAITEKMIEQEPLANTLLLYLAKNKQVDYKEVIGMLEEKTTGALVDMIEEQRKTDEDSTFCAHGIL